MNCSEIQIRDPFILRSDAENRYYLYGTTDKNAWSGKATGFDAYMSYDLKEWQGPFPVFRPAADFWADENFWAPEVYFFKGKYYMAASFSAAGSHRGVQLLRSDSPIGAFHPLGNRPVTPSEWDCLDGTLHFDEAEQAWIVFSHEWMQVGDGQMCCMKLTEDLNAAAGDPLILFTASQAPWSVPNTGDIVKREGENYVTDGPFIYKTRSGTLLMLWSSYSSTGYSIGISYSVSGKITGPWEHLSKPVYKKNGGHGMLFHTFDGKLILAIHSPNTTPFERLKLISARENGELIEIDTQ